MLDIADSDWMPHNATQRLVFKRCSDSVSLRWNIRNIKGLQCFHIKLLQLSDTVVVWQHCPVFFSGVHYFSLAWNDLTYISTHQPNDLKTDGETWEEDREQSGAKSITTREKEKLRQKDAITYYIPWQPCALRFLGPGCNPILMHEATCFPQKSIISSPRKLFPSACLWWNSTPAETFPDGPRQTLKQQHIFPHIFFRTIRTPFPPNFTVPARPVTGLDRGPHFSSLLCGNLTRKLGK